jgi:Zn-dependent M28 family amino/carboxypeptidase
MKRMIFSLSSLLLLMSLMGCERSSTVPPPQLDAALNSLTTDELAQHIQALASDEFEGRAPASKGEELTIDYIANQFKQYGLQPGITDGTYFQKVPLVGITADPNMELTFAAGSKTLQLKYRDDFVAATKRVVDQTGITNSDLVFVGYGVAAPEYGWDDYKGLDVKGKTVVMLINDPPVPDPSDPSKLDPKMFGGAAMTYYGRWTYKYEIAAEKGADGCIIIHETGPAGYPWEVVKNSWSGEEFDLVAPDKNMSRCAVESWITYDNAKELFHLAGQDLDGLKKEAVSKDFKPVALDATASVTINNTIRTSDSNNVIAKLEGSDQQLKGEYVIYVAHWDHLGKNPALEGDQIFNGAVDNASGTACLLELAQAFTKLPAPPRRSVVFLAVTAEEQGLLGSKYYAENPIYPPAKTVAVINMDAMNVLGQTKDVTVIGLGMSSLDDHVKTVAAEQQRTVRPDPQPEKGFYYRSDHFNFAKAGVPALYVDSGVEYVGKPEGWGLQMQEKYTAENYHKPSDQYDSSWDLSGLVQDSQLLFTVGYRVANQTEYPTWNPGTEFKAKRDQMLKSSSK